MTSIRALLARLDEPHSRRRRTVRRNLARLALWPLAAATIVIALIGFTQPTALNGQPTERPARVVVER